MSGVLVEGKMAIWRWRQRLKGCSQGHQGWTAAGRSEGTGKDPTQSLGGVSEGPCRHLAGRPAASTTGRERTSVVLSQLGCVFDSSDPRRLVQPRSLPRLWALSPAGRQSENKGGLNSAHLTDRTCLLNSKEESHRPWGEWCAPRDCPAAIESDLESITWTCSFHGLAWDERELWGLWGGEREIRQRPPQLREMQHAPTRSQAKQPALKSFPSDSEG